MNHSETHPAPAAETAPGAAPEASLIDQVEGVVVIGPPGAGKSTIGRLLAEGLRLPWRDTDLMIERAAGRTISEIFIDEGEPAFRVLEREAVAEALAGPEAVISLGGGSVLDAGTRAALTGRTVVFLDVSLTAAAPRVGFNRDRPLLVGNPRAQWQRLMNDRRPVYEALATITVDTSGRSPHTVVEAILTELHLGTRCASGARP